LHGHISDIKAIVTAAMDAQEGKPYPSKDACDQGDQGGREAREQSVSASRAVVEKLKEMTLRTGSHMRGALIVTSAIICGVSFPRSSSGRAELAGCPAPQVVATALRAMNLPHADWRTLTPAKIRSSSQQLLNQLDGGRYSVYVQIELDTTGRKCRRVT